MFINEGLLFFLFNFFSYMMFRYRLLEKWWNQSFFFLKKLCFIYWYLSFVIKFIVFPFVKYAD